MRVCSRPGCPVTYPKKDGSYCESHRREIQRAVDAKRPSSSKRGYNQAWRRIRRRQLDSQPWCEDCGREATEVDHIVALRRGGSNNPDNLQSLCKPCHSRKTSAVDGAFGRDAV